MFDRRFYDFIYGSIHHHDYAAGRADELIRMYGKGRYLELGAGCGILIKALREQGVDAWGIEISDYALSETCCPELIRADARHLPFPDQSFTLVHSWAVFGYCDEQGTKQMIRECNRVGSHQYHSIDFQVKYPYPYGYVFMKPRPWWDSRMVNGC